MKLASLLLCFCSVGALSAEVVVTETHRLTPVLPGIYLAQTAAPLFNSNALIIVNAEDVLVVDSHITPAKGQQLVESIKAVTDKPITTLVNSHFHYDHAHGNQSFPAGVQIIGHEFTRMKMAGEPLKEHTFVRGLAGTKGWVERLRAQVEAAGSEDEAAKAQAQLDVMQAHLDSWHEVAPVAPDVTLKERLTLFRGDREIQLLFLGRAHTGGDVSVYLPKEKLIFTGDMMLAGPSWLGDGYVDEWDETLEALKQLDFQVIVPGHGPAFTDRSRIDYVQAFYRDLWTKTEALYQRGVPIEEAAAQIDMTNHKESLGINAPGFDPLGVARMYQRMEELGL